MNRRDFLKTAGAGLVAADCYTWAGTSATSSLLVEAESFKERGGWVLDQQAMDKMGAPYLMAHGLGLPVANAKRSITIVSPGAYHVYARTHNWTSTWYDGEGPGAFKLIVNGTPLAETLGTRGNEWHWQYAGAADLPAGKTALELHDLTGFNGRVDAFYFTQEKGAVPPNDSKTLNTFRRKMLSLPQTEAGPFDLVVVGAGVAGCSAALSAARLGLKVALLSNRPILGGANSPEIGVGLAGEPDKNLYRKIGNITRELSGNIVPKEGEKERLIEPPWGRGKTGTSYLPVRGTEPEVADLRLKIVREEKNISLYLNTHATGVEMEGSRIAAVRAKSIETGEETLFRSKLFADCTGDGSVGHLAGADYVEGREARDFADEPTAPQKADDLHMGMSVLWETSEEDKLVDFPALVEIPWVGQGYDKCHVKGTKAHWWWETGFRIDNATEAEVVRDNALRTMFGNWSYLKNNLKLHPNHQLSRVRHIGGKRESRRLLGDVVLNENDIVEQVPYPDASYTTTWSIDLHYPQRGATRHFPGWEWLSHCTQDHIAPYHVPYRTLYSRNIENLFMAGRCVSVTHIALGTVRVQVTTGMMGEVVGCAATVCCQHNTFPRGVYAQHLDELKKQMELGIPTKPNALQQETV
ncbi:MAG: FAD-dependent oxidoreductase [Verrucomicrobia bacterium]|nr:FAD-dependent oxidoreductase [Verrucomicrobiota bacterium]